MPVTEGFVCWTEPIGTVGPCQYITNRLGCIDIAARAGSITKPADANIAQGNSLGTFDGINSFIFTVCPQVPSIPTTTTTVAPITLTLTASCIGSGVNGTPVVLSGATSYTWNNLVNSVWFVILTDNLGNTNYAQVTVSCTNTTTTTSTSTTTTAAPICTFNGGTAVVIYPATTTTTSTSTTSTTTGAPANTTTTSTTTTTTTAAPQCTYDGLTILCDGYSWVFHGGGSGYSTSAAALASFSGGPNRYSNSNAMIGSVTTFYTDTGLTTVFNGGDLWYRVQLNGAGTNYAARINSSGLVTTYTS